MALTDFSVRNAKPTEKVRTISDSHGLQLRILPSGGKSWRWSYRFDGVQKSIGLGRYPGVSLSQARAARDEAAATLARGVDPIAQRAENEAAAVLAKGETFVVVAAEVVDKLRREGKAPATIVKREWLLGLALPSLGSRPVAEITPREVLVVLQSVEAKGLFETARRLRSAMSGVFRRAVATGRAERDPCEPLRGALTSPTVAHQKAVTDGARLGEVLRLIDGYRGRGEVKTGLWLLALTAVRPGELRFARWGEFDLDAGEWLVPAERTKMRRPHRVALAPAAVTRLRAMQARSAHTAAEDLLFPGFGDRSRPISENTLNKALRSLGVTDHVGHGFRSTFSSIANDSRKWSADAMELSLGHAIGGGAVRGVYARHELWDERVELMAWWADRLEALRTAAAE